MKRKKQAAKPKSKTASGRKQGSQTRTYQSADTTATRCPVCGSTDRLPYSKQDELQSHGRAPDGKPCTHIKLQWTSCKSCGQARIDRTFLNRSAD